MNKDLISIKDNLQTLKKSYILAILIVLSFGMYKNISYCLDKDLSLTELLFKSSYIIIAPFIGLLLDSLASKKINIASNFIICIILTMTLPYNTNIFVFILSLFLLIGLDFLDKNHNFNKICIVKILLIIFMLVFNSYSYLNPVEINNEYAYSLFDIFIGKQVGGMFSTSVLAILIGFCLLSMNMLYKNKIVSLSYLTYLITLIIIMIFSGNYLETIKLMLNSSAIFAFVFIAPFNEYSPYKPKEILIYSLIIGSLSAVISLTLFVNDGAIISILVGNLIIFLIKTLKKRQIILK